MQRLPYHQKDKIVYTSDKSGDLELHVCDLDGKMKFKSHGS